MSANPDVWSTSGLIGSPVEAVEREVEILHESESWNVEGFAREQIRCLVRRVFFGNDVKPVKQVVFSPAGPTSNVPMICEQIGRSLAQEASSDVAIVVRDSAPANVAPFPHRAHSASLKSSSVQIGTNVWRVLETGSSERRAAFGLGRYWLARLAELRSEFEYAVIQGPVAGASNEAALLAELADGIVLVLGAGARRAAVRKVKETLETGQSRILGTILSERTFPIPERIYQRL
jgi:hypothetical protein